jgi:hypothetical protein
VTLLIFLELLATSIEYVGEPAMCWRISHGLRDVSWQLELQVHGSASARLGQRMAFPLLREFVFESDREQIWQRDALAENRPKKKVSKTFAPSA